MTKYLALSPYNYECLELGVCFYDDEQENYQFFSWGEQSVECVVEFIGKKVEEYKITKVIFRQISKTTKIVKNNFSSLSSLCDFQTVSGEIVKEVNVLLTKGVYSVINLVMKSGFWYVGEQRLLTNHHLMAYLALVHHLENETGQKLIEANEEPLPPIKTYKTQPSVVLVGKILECNERMVKSGAVKGGVFYCLTIKHDDEKYPRPLIVFVFFGMLRDESIWEKLVNQGCLGNYYKFYCWSNFKGFNLSYWEEVDEKVLNNINKDDGNETNK